MLVCSLGYRAIAVATIAPAAGCQPSLALPSQSVGAVPACSSFTLSSCPSSSCSATTVYGMLLLDVALYFALLWYLDKVRGSQGVVWMIL